MRAKRLSLALILAGLHAFAANFGMVVTRPEGFGDVALDEARRRLYLVNTVSGTVDVYNVSANPAVTPPARGPQIRVGAQPISLALSRSGRYLYVTCYQDSLLDVIDLDRAAPAVATRLTLPAKPQGVAVGSDERVLVSTIGTGQGQATLIVYDPSAAGAANLTTVVITPPAQTPPALPPPNSRVYLAGRGRLLASADGRVIVGVNLPSGTTGSGTVFVYEPRSATVLRSRSVTNLSPVISVSPDGSKFMAGSTLFDTATLAVLAQQNAANAPFVFPTGTSGNFNLQQNQGGSVFSPDGARVYSGFNMAPVTSPASRANASRLLVSDPDNLLTSFGLQLPESLAGKMAITRDGAAIYALSESGFLVLPVGSVFASPIVSPESAVVLLSYDQCGVTKPEQTATVAVRNAGSGRMSITASLLQLPNTGPVGLGGAGGPGGGGTAGAITIVTPPVVPGPDGRPAGVTVPTGTRQAATIQTSPYVQTRPSGAGADITFQFNPLAARSPGTVPPHDFLLQSSEAINIAPTVRVYQNNRNTEARGTVFPVPIGIAISEGLVDMVMDSGRQRLYIANSGLNRVEVFDIRRNAFLAPIKVGQLPRSLTLGMDGLTLYVANSGGEHISIVDLEKGAVTGRVKFPPIPFNAAFPLVTPSVIAASVRGLQVVMSDGTLWKVVGDTAQPRPLPPVFGAARAIPGPIRTMAASPEGQRILLLAGNGTAYLYRYEDDEYVVARQVVPAPIQGYFGPIAAGPRGQYYLVNNVILNESLTNIGGTDPQPGAIPGQPPPELPGGRPGLIAASSGPVAAVTAAGARNFVRYAAPLRTSTAQLPADAGVVELVDVATGRVTASVSALETPLATVIGTQRTNTNGRTIAVNAEASAAYVLTTTGLSVLPIEPAVAALRELPSVNRNGIVNTASYLAPLAPGTLFAIFGRNLGTQSTADSTPLPSILGGTCVTLGNTPVPLIMTSNGQINGQIPPNLAAGRHNLTIRSVDNKAASAATAITVSRYAPAVFVAGDGQPAILHEDGRYVSKDNPAKRDERLVIYATGLGATKGGGVNPGEPAPSSPPAVTDKVQVFFGNPGYREAEMIVEWSGLAPGLIGIYQIDIRVPGTRIRGPALPVQIRIGGVNSPSAGPAIPYVAVE